MNNKNETREYRIEQLTESKLKDIETLYKEVYGHKPEKNYLLKKYNTAYTGTQYTGYIAYNQKDIPIAFFGVIPCFIQYDNKIVLSAQAVDAMTLLQYRNTGIFVELAKTTFDLCKAKKIKLVFGFPNQNSYHALVDKLGWKMTENMELFIVPADSFPLESMLQHFRWAKWIYKKYTKWILQKYLLLQQGLSNAVIREGYGGIHRDEQYLQYKTYSDTLVIKIESAKIWIKIKNGLIIGDIYMAEDNFNLIINTIKKIAKCLCISQIYFQTSPGTKLHALFAQQYKSTPSFAVIFLDLGAGISLDKIKFSFADIDIF